MSDTDGVDRDDLQDSSESDDEAVTPPDTMPRATEWGTTAEEQEQGETINQRIAQEVPDPDSAYGAPDNRGYRPLAGESGLDGSAPVGGDDPDAIAAEDDWLGDDAGDSDAGRLISDDAGEHSDSDAQDWGTDVGSDGGDASPEESAMHIVTGADTDDISDSDTE